MLAIDLGAESGRAILGRFDGRRIRTREIHRFPNVPVTLPDGLHWDALSIQHEIVDAISSAGASTGGVIDSIGIDSWGVDFGLLDRSGALIGNPYHYRDKRTEGMLERAFRQVPRQDVYRATGIQAMPINTLSQLLVMVGSPALSIADTMLPMPDLFRYWLSGERSAEYTIATTTQLFAHERADWAWDIIDGLGIPAEIFPSIVGSTDGGARLLAEINRTASLRRNPVVVPVASHDTASAVVAVPAHGERFAYISSGTWSLVGVELDGPVLSDEAMDADFTNEGGAFGTIRFLKNVMGLWLLQECRRTWARNGNDLGYDQIVAAAESAQPFRFLIDPDDPAFLAPESMPASIAAYCQRTGQDAPDGIAELSRCILESLALKYRWVIERITQITGREIDVVHVVGGGSRNAMLTQFTADAIQLPVVAGPVEATALGNLLVQASTQGELGSLEEIREVVRASTELVTYEPSGDRHGWDEAYGRFLKLMRTNDANVDMS